jgi:thiol-disulfide isomerase/thioredoxin
MATARWFSLMLLVRVHRSEFISSFDKNSTSLFTRTSDVTELDEGMFNALHTPPGLSGVSIVTFYAPSCPHCQWFAPHLQTFATHFAKLQDIHFYGMNCECDTTHEDMCVRAKIPDTPTIRAFHHGKQINQTLNDDFSFLVAWIFNITRQLSPGSFSQAAQVQINHQIATDVEREKLIALETDSKRTAHLMAWPEMPGHRQGLAKLKWQLQANFRFIDTNQDGSLIADEICAASVWTVGRKVSRDDCVAVVREADEDSSKGLEMAELLAVMLQGTVWHRFGSETVGGQAVKRDEDESVNPRDITAAAVAAATWQHGGLKSEGSTTNSTSSTGRVDAHMRLVDAALAVLYGLHHGVFLGASTLSASRKSALIAWLLVLHRTFPGPAENREALRSLLEAVTVDPSLSTLDGWRKYLRGWRFGYGLGGSKGGMHSQWLQEQHVREYEGLESSGKVVSPATRSAQADDYDRPGRAGGACGCAGEDAAMVASSGDVFTCRLWTLFHMMAVCAANIDGYPADRSIDRKATTNAQAVGGSAVRPQHVMEAIEQYVKHFFGCRVCRDHFLLEYEACDHKRCQISTGAKKASGDEASGDEASDHLSDQKDTAAEWMRLTLWLWRAHNDVSVRLAWQRRVRLSHGGSWRVDPFFRSVSWPPPSDCLLCYSFEPLTSSGHTTRNATGADRGRARGWNEDEVYRYIVQSYHPDYSRSRAGTWFGTAQGTDFVLQQQRWLLGIGLLGCFFATFLTKLKVKLRQHNRRRSRSIDDPEQLSTRGLMKRSPSNSSSPSPTQSATQPGNDSTLAKSIEKCLRFARPRAKTV